MVGGGKSRGGPGGGERLASVLNLAGGLHVVPAEVLVLNPAPREVLMRRFLVVPLIAAGLAVAGPASAGQPNASCESAGANPPPGFSTGGFERAESVYAGSEGTPSAANGSSHAVSQYDIACFRGPKH